MIRIERTNLENYFVARTLTSLTILHVVDGKLDVALKTESTDVYALSIDSTSKDPIFVAYYDSLMTAKAFNLKNSKSVFHVRLGPEQQAPITRLAFLASEKVYEFVSVRSDCRMDLHEAQIGMQGAAIAWTRYEGLATTASVEMIDLPLSESQATIETEFTAKDGEFPYIVDGIMSLRSYMYSLTYTEPDAVFSLI